MFKDLCIAGKILKIVLNYYADKLHSCELCSFTEESMITCNIGAYLLWIKVFSNKTHFLIILLALSFEELFFLFFLF